MYFRFLYNSGYVSVLGYYNYNVNYKTICMHIRFLCISIVIFIIDVTTVYILPIKHITFPDNMIRLLQLINI